MPLTRAAGDPSGCATSWAESRGAAAYCTAVLNAPPGTRAGRASWPRVLGGAACSFVIGFAAVLGWRLYHRGDVPLSQCAHQLRTLYVARRRAPAAARGGLEAIRNVLSGQFLVTEEEDRYLSPRKPTAGMRYAGPELEALICPLDPAFGEKIGLALAETGDFPSSYTWNPDAGILVYCPFHRRALREDGRVEEVAR